MGKKREEKMQKKKKEKYTATIKINFPRLLAYQLIFCNNICIHVFLNSPKCLQNKPHKHYCVRINRACLHANICYAAKK